MGGGRAEAHVSKSCSSGTGRDFPDPARRRTCLMGACGGVRRFVRHWYALPRGRVLCPPPTRHRTKRAPGHAPSGHDDCCVSFRGRRPRTPGPRPPAGLAPAPGGGLRPPCRADPPRRCRPGPQLDGPGGLSAAEPAGPGRSDGCQGAGCRDGHRLLDGDAAGRAARRHRSGQAHLAPGGRPGRRAPALAARPGPPRRGPGLAARADVPGDGRLVAGGTGHVLRPAHPVQLLLAARQAAHHPPQSD